MSFFDNNNNILSTATYHKLTYSGLLLNFDSFTSLFQKISLIKCLIDRSYKINNKWAIFHNYLIEIKETLKRNSFPLFLIDKIVKSYWEKLHSCSDQSNPESDKTPFTGFHTLEIIQSKFRKTFQKTVKSSAKLLILKWLLLILKLITISQLKVKHPVL